MKIKNKIIYMLSGLFLLLLAWTFLIYQLYALPSITELEKQTHLRYSELFSKAIDIEMEKMATITRDWTYWDDMYAFIDKPNDLFRQSNLGVSSLEVLKMDLMLIFGDRQQPMEQFYSKNVTASELGNQQQAMQNGIIKISDQFRSRLTSGVLATKMGLVAVSGGPVFRSDGSGDAKGAFVLGQLLNSSYTGRLSDRYESQIQLSIVPFSKQESVDIALTPDSVIISKYLPLLNVRDSLLKLTFEQPRTLFMQETHIADRVLYSLLFGAIFISIAIYLLLDYIIIKPLAALEASVKHFELHHELPPVRVKQKSDEIGELTRILFTLGNQVKDSWSQLRAERNDFLKASNTDPLTKLWNRRYVEETLSAPSCWSRPNNWLFMMIDIDHFKQINDNFGHDAGDIAIRQIASVLRYLSRTDDIVMRYGGEEFALICRNVDEKVGCVIAERIRGAIEGRRFGHQGASFKLTCSIGFFTLWVEELHAYDHWRSMLKVADMALYAAKNAGRNRWVGLKTSQETALASLPQDGKSLQDAIDKQAFALYTSAVESGPLKWQ